MPFAETIACEITLAHPRHLEHLARLIWQGHASGALTDDQAQSLAEQLRDRQHVPHHGPGPTSAPAAVCESARAHLRRPPRSPDRQRSLERRRRLSAAGGMPPGISCKFTVGERAALYVIASEVQRRGQCDLYVDAIAGRAGVSRSTVKNALREGKRLGLITVDERRIGHRYNDANRVRITSPEWRLWLAHGREQTVKLLTRTDNQIDKRSRFAAGSSVLGGQPAQLPVGRSRESG